MRLSKKDKRILYNECFIDRKDHIEGLLENEEFYYDKETTYNLKEELKIIYKAMKQIEIDLNNENLCFVEYSYYLLENKVGD